MFSSKYRRLLHSCGMLCPSMLPLMDGVISTMCHAYITKHLRQCFRIIFLLFIVQLLTTLAAYKDMNVLLFLGVGQCSPDKKSIAHINDTMGIILTYCDYYALIFDCECSYIDAYARQLYCGCIVNSLKKAKYIIK